MSETYSYDVYEFDCCGDLYSCVIKNAEVSAKNQRISSLPITPKKKSKDHVKGLWIKESYITNIPCGLTEFFPNIVAIEIQKCKLKEVIKEDLREFVSLRHLCLPRNEITSLPSDLFVYTRSLKYISFAGNKIEYIGKHLFAPLDPNVLQIFDLSQNRSINMVISSENKILQQATQYIRTKCQNKIDVKDSVSEFAKEAHLWETREFTDFKFVFPHTNEEIAVHKCILAPQSPVFCAMFKTNMLESCTNEAQITDISAQGFEEFLEYLYIRKLPDFNECIVDVYGCSVKYQIDKLAAICEELIIDNINADNATDVLELANIYDNELMKIVAFEEIKKLFTNRNLSNEWMNEPKAMTTLVAAEILRSKKINDANDEFEVTFQSVLPIHNQTAL